MAEIYLESSEWVLAEKQLSTLVVRRPDFSLQLAKIKIKLGRDSVYIQRYLIQAESSYRDQLAAHPDDAGVWMALSETMLLSGRPETAREILVEQLAKKDNSSMRRQLSDQSLSQAEMLANAAPLNLDRSLIHPSRLTLKIPRPDRFAAFWFFRRIPMAHAGFLSRAMAPDRGTL